MNTVPSATFFFFLTMGRSQALRPRFWCTIWGWVGVRIPGATTPGTAGQVLAPHLTLTPASGEAGPGTPSALTPQVPPHSPPPNLLGDGLGHGASCTGHVSQVRSKVVSTLSLLELSYGWEAGWHHCRLTPWKASGSPPDISPLRLHPTWPCQRPKYVPSAYACQALF